MRLIRVRFTVQWVMAATAGFRLRFAGRRERLS